MFGKRLLFYYLWTYFIIYGYAQEAIAKQKVEQALGIAKELDFGEA